MKNIHFMLFIRDVGNINDNVMQLIGIIRYFNNNNSGIVT